MYIEKLHKVLSPIGFYVWKPLNNDDIEEQVDYIHYRLLFNELTKEQNDLIIAAGNLKFVYSIDMNVDIRGKKYLFIRITDFLLNFFLSKLKLITSGSTLTTLQPRSLNSFVLLPMFAPISNTVEFLLIKPD